MEEGLKIRKTRQSTHKITRREAMQARNQENTKEFQEKQNKQQPEKAMVSLIPLLPRFLFLFRSQTYREAYYDRLTQRAPTKLHTVDQHQHKATPTAYNNKAQRNKAHNDSKAPAKQQQSVTQQGPQNTV